MKNISNDRGTIVSGVIVLTSLDQTNYEDGWNSRREFTTPTNCNVRMLNRNVKCERLLSSMAYGSYRALKRMESSNS